MFDELFNVIKTFNIKPIILERGEYKEQIISYCYANEIKCFHNFNNQPNINNINNDVKIDLNFLKKTIKEFKECKKNKEKSLKYFNDNKIEYLHLKYNEIITNDGKIKFLNFIGLDFLEEYATIETEKK